MPRVPRIICPGMPVMPGYSRIRRQIPVMAPAAPGAAGRTWAAVASCPAGPLANAAPAVSAVTEITATPMTAAILVAFTPRPGPRCQPGSAGPRAVGLGQQRDRGHDGCSPAFMSASIVVVGRNIVYFGAPP